MGKWDAEIVSDGEDESGVYGAQDEAGCQSVEELLEPVDEDEINDIIQGMARMHDKAEMKELQARQLKHREQELTAERKGRQLAEIARATAHKDLEYEFEKRVALEQQLAEAKQELTSLRTLKNQEGRDLELARFIKSQEEEAKLGAQEQLQQNQTELRHANEQVSLLEDQIAAAREEVYEKQRELNKEKDRRRAAEEEVVKASNELEEERDERLAAESEIEELIFQRNLLEAELKAMEEKSTLLEMGVKGTRHKTVEVPGMDRHALEKELQRKEEVLKEEERKARSREEIWAADRSALQAQLSAATDEAKRLREQLASSREEELRLRREMDSRVKDLTRAQNERAAADEERMALGMQAEKLKADSKQKHFSVRELNNHIERLSAENDSIRSKLRRSEARREELDDEVDRLEAQLRAAQRSELILKAGIEDEGEQAERSDRGSRVEQQVPTTTADDYPKKVVGKALRSLKKRH